MLGPLSFSGNDELTEQTRIIYFRDAGCYSHTGGKVVECRLIRSCCPKTVRVDNHAVACAR
jgi:hypothetical protein